MATSSTHVAALVKNSRERVRVRLTEHLGNQLVDLRVFDHTGPTEFPTKSGFAVQASHLPALRTAIEDAIRAAAAKGWLADDLVPADLRPAPSARRRRA